MPLVVASVFMKGTILKDWFGTNVTDDITLADFYTSFCSGEYDNEPVAVESRRSFVKVFVGEFKH